MDLIWAKREAKYFCVQDWTGSISLIGFEKIAFGRKSVQRGLKAQPSGSTLLGEYVKIVIIIVDV